MSYDEKEIKIANKTTRLHKDTTWGDNAVVPRAVRLMAQGHNTLLDFGSGKYPKHGLKLRDDGYDVTFYEFGDNVTDYHDVHALEKAYDIVYASNVLNTLSSEAMIHMTLAEIHTTMKPGGIFIFNIPKDPRKNDLTDEQYLDIIKDYFIIRKLHTIKGAYVATRLVAW